MKFLEDLELNCQAKRKGRASRCRGNPFELPLKQSPRKPSRKHLEVLIEHLSWAWLEAFGDLDAIFEGIVDTKIRHFASQASSLDVAELKDCSLPKCYTLMLALKLMSNPRG